MVYCTGGHLFCHVHHKLASHPPQVPLHSYFPGCSAALLSVPHGGGRGGVWAVAHTAGGAEGEGLCCSHSSWGQGFVCTMVAEGGLVWLWAGKEITHQVAVMDMFLCCLFSHGSWGIARVIVTVRGGAHCLHGGRGCT